MTGSSRLWRLVKEGRQLWLPGASNVGCINTIHCLLLTPPPLLFTSPSVEQRIGMSTIFNALLRTHHITSRKKVAALTQAARKHEVYALLRSGGSPGIMYVEGSKDGVTAWVADAKVSHHTDPAAAQGQALTMNDIEAAISQLQTSPSTSEAAVGTTCRPSHRSGYHRPTRARRGQGLWRGDGAPRGPAVVAQRDGIRRPRRPTLNLPPGRPCCQGRDI